MVKWMSLNNSVKQCLLLLVINLLVAFAINGLVSFKELIAWFYYPSYDQLMVFLKDVLTSGLLVTGLVLLLKTNALAPATIIRSKNICLQLVLIILNVLIIHYLPNATLAFIGEENYWLMLYSDMLVYYINSCYLAGLLVMIVIAKLILATFTQQTVNDDCPCALSSLLMAFSLWMIGLNLYHTNELLVKLTVSFAISEALTNQITLLIFYIMLFFVYVVVIPIAVLLIYQQQMKIKPYYLLRIGVIIWLLPLLMSDSFSLMLNKFGYLIMTVLFFSMEAFIVWLIGYLCFRKFNHAGF